MGLVPSIVAAITVTLSATTTFMTVRQTSKRGLMQTNVDPDNPMAASQKYMMYIVPFFSLTGLYWQYGLVLYWVTTNLWTLGQQWFMFRNWDTGRPAAGAAAAASSPAWAAPSSPRRAAGAAAAAGAAGAAGTARAARAANGTKTAGTAKTGSGGTKTGSGVPAARRLPRAAGARCGPRPLCRRDGGSGSASTGPAARRPVRRVVMPPLRPPRGAGRRCPQTRAAGTGPETGAGR